MVIVAAIGILAIVVYIIDKVGPVVIAHLPVIIGTVVLGGTMLVILLRMILRAATPRTVKAWPAAPVKPPKQPKPELPEPLADSTAAGRPFTKALPETPALPLDSSLLACEGPGCTCSLPTNPDLRWRSGTATAPQTAPEHGGGGGGTIPLHVVGTIHEFCSRRCMSRYIEEEDASEPTAR